MKRNLKFSPTCSTATFGDNDCFEPRVATVSISDSSEEVIIVKEDASALPLPPFKDMQVDSCLKRGDSLESVATDILQPVIK